MKIGYVLKQFPKLSETFVLNEILAMEELGHEVTVYSLSVPHESRIHGAVGRLRGDILQLGVGRTSEFAHRLAATRGLYRACSPDALDAVFDLLGRGGRDPFRYLKQALELHLDAHERGIEHLHAHFAGPASDVAQLVARLLHIPSSFTCHAKDIFHESVDTSMLRQRVHASEAVITVCEENRRYLEERVCGQPVDHLHVLYNGIDVHRFHPAQRHESNTPLVLAVGRLVEKKGFADLLRALALLPGDGPPPHCVIAGEGRERAELERLRQELGLEDRVELLGAVDQSHVRSLLQRATLLCQPCVVGEDGNQDALPTVILEAMAAGVPVVSTPVGGIEEMVVDRETGRLVPPRQPERLARALQEMLAEDDERERMALAGRQRCERLFELRRNVRTLATILEECRPSRRARVAS